MPSGDEESRHAKSRVHLHDVSAELVHMVAPVRHPMRHNPLAHPHRQLHHLYSIRFVCHNTMEPLLIPVGRIVHPRLRRILLRT